MAIWQSTSGRRALEQWKSRKVLSTRAPRKGKRSLGLEPFEERLLMAIDGPQLLAAIPATGIVINDGTILSQAPREILLRFSAPINATTVSNASIQFLRSSDTIWGNANDVAITPGYIGVDNPNFPNEVVVRFNENLPDANYRMIIVGGGANPLKDTAGKAFQDGANLTRDFELDLAPQVVAIVPQPITRDAQGKLSLENQNKIEVYFNVNDPLNQASAQNPANYQLIRTSDVNTANPTASTLDDVRFNPQSVTYNATTGKATLTFKSDEITANGTYRLRIGTSEALATSFTNLSPGTAGDAFATAAQLNNPFPSGLGTKTVAITSTIGSVATSAVWPGSPLEPGERENYAPEGANSAHVNGGPNTSAVQIKAYNFQSQFGTLNGIPQFNLITEAQKDRVREVFEYYGYYLGVQFVETASDGYTIAVGDPRVLIDNLQVGGVAGGNLAIMNSIVNWGASETRGAFFRTTMHEVGHLLGLGHNYEAPAIQGSGISDGVLPGDFDILYGKYLWPTLGNDINVYRFSLATAGRLNLETIAERMRAVGVAAADSTLDSVITVYDVAGNIIARNDDYFGKDSFLQLDLSDGTYYVAVTSTGNTNFDPRVAKSGAGGTTVGDFQLRMSFTPTTAAADGIRDLSDNHLDGDNDGVAGGVNNFWFKVAETRYVDKASTGGTGSLGSITNPYTRISDALAAAPVGTIVRIVGNGGADGNLATVGDNAAYNIGFDAIGGALSDGTRFEIPRGVTVMVDAGAIIKLRGANVNAGSVDPTSIDRSQGALQVLGTPTNQVYFTSYYDNTIGAPVPNLPGVTKGNWGGIVFRNDSDLEANGVFLNYVNMARISYGGGTVTVNGETDVYRPIHMETARPTLTYNTVIDSAAAAMSATPNSFEESQFQGAAYYADYTRIGPKIYGNTLTQNSLNGLYIAIETSSQTGRVLDELTVTGRIANTDIVHILTETLVINGNPGGMTGSVGSPQSRPSGSLIIDPGTVFKLSGGRFETEVGGTLIAEGTLNRPIIFTSLYDDRYGRSGSSDTSNNGNPSQPDVVGPTAGDWGGFLFGPTSTASLDYTLVAFAGGDVRFEGFLSSMDPIEIHQAKVRVANSTFQANRLAGGGERNGRGSSDPAVIYIRGAQPVILNNIFEGNLGGAAISVNVNSLNATLVDDWGRSRGAIGLAGSFPKNTGPLIRNNLVGDNSINGMVVRGGLITTNSIWDDTDIVHVVRDSVTTGNQQSLSGTLRLQSSPTESLVVKVLGTNVDIVAGGEALDIRDRLGGSLQIVGTAGHPVVITSLKDDTVGAGLTPQGQPQKDTRNTKGVIAPVPANSATTGPIFLDTAARDVHGNSRSGDDGWDTLRDELRYVFENSKVVNKPNSILVIGWETAPEPFDDLGVPYSANAIRWAAGQLGLQVTFADDGPEIAGGIANAVNGQYAAIFIPSHGNPPSSPDVGPGYPLPVGRAQEHANIKWWGGVSDLHLETLNDAGVKANLINYLDNKGGGLLAMALDSSEVKYNFLAGFTLRAGGGNVMSATAASIDGFTAAEISEGDLNIGTPYRSTFEGPSGFNRFVPWAVDSVTGEVAILGRVAGGPVIGPAQDIVRAGDWGSVRLDLYSNDTNVEIVNEIEQGFPSSGDANQTPNTAQSIGELAKDLLSGNDNVRLGFEIYGGLSQATDSPGGADVDVYSFRATAGTMVWFDIDRTATSLDSVLELVDANGAVIARSNDSLAEDSNPSLLVGSAKRMRSGAELTSAFSNPDFYSTNEKDAGMRVLLTGSAGSVNTYYVRVRSNSANLNNLTGGVTKGSYVLQIRLQEIDQFAGSTIRYADIRYANNGIEIIGKPQQSALVSNTIQSSFQGFDENGVFINGNRTFENAQNLGNLLESDNSTIEVVGNLTTGADWYRFNVNFEQVQAFGDIQTYFAAMLQINFADGLGRPDTTLSLYDASGTLIMIARDGEIADSLPRPNVGGIGNDTTNLRHGSYGVFDPTLGSVVLPGGGPTASSPVATYYVAVSSAAAIPDQLMASFMQNSINPLVRLEPVDSTRRIIDDRVGSSGSGITTAGSSGQLFGGGLSNYVDDYHLGDVVMFVNQIQNGNQRLVTVNPFTGQVTTVGGVGLTAQGENQIAMRNDGQLMALEYGNTNTSSGNYSRINTATGALTDLGDDGTQLSIVSGPREPGEPWPTQQTQTPLQYTAMTFYSPSQSSGQRKLFAMSQRSTSPGPGGLMQNILVELDPDTGAALHVSDEGPWNANSTGGPRSLTNFVPLGILTVGGANDVADQMVGMAIVGGEMYTITADGRLFRLSNNWNVNEATDSVNIDGTFPPKQIAIGGRTLTTMVAGPQNVEGGAYANMLFAMDTEGRMYAFDTNGNMRGVFLNGSASLDTGLQNVHGIALSPFDYNLWGATTNRASDVGHGIESAYHGARTRELAAQLTNGGTSYYFGVTGNQPLGGAVGSNTDLQGSYAVPGGTYGSITSDTFDLAGYSAYDKPTLYFNYFLDTPDNNSLRTLTNSATDAFRVYASTDGIGWSLLATSNVVPGSNESPSFNTPSGGSYTGGGTLAAKQKVQSLWDSTTLEGSDEVVWRQARVDLGDFAGQSNIRLRFQFSTAGSMGSDVGQLGRVLSTIPGNKIVNNSEFTIAGIGPGGPAVVTYRMVKGAASAPNDIVISDNDTAEQVARKIAAALDISFTDPALDDPNSFTTAKVVGGELRFFGNHTVVSAGPFRFSDNVQYTGDEYGNLSSRTRDRTGVFFEGVYLDDFIVGFASRGEMVTNAEATQGFVPVPKPSYLPSQIVTGAYQLQIRPADRYTAVGSSGFNLASTFDINDRLAQGFTLVAPTPSAGLDGITFRIDDGLQNLTFELDTNSAQNVPNSVLISVSGLTTDAQVAQAIANAINSTVTSRGFKVRARAANNGPRVDLFDALQVTSNSSGTLGIIKYDGVGDTRPQASAVPPGQTILQNTTVSHSFGVGIQVVPKMNQIAETGLAATAMGLIPIGSAGQTGAAALLPSFNTRAWVPGVTLKNNLVIDSGRTGIQVGGDPSANYSYNVAGDDSPTYYRNGRQVLRRDTELLVPFVRIVNNTVYKARIGIAATNTSSPTILNNVISNITEVPQIGGFAGTGAAIYVDGSSGAPKDLPSGALTKFGDTVVSANVYKNNRVNLVGTSETLAIVLGENEPLFVNAPAGNFYLDAQSKAIDSSIDSLLDRAELLNVIAPLGFAPSPILAPPGDLLGQQRVDDPTVAPPTGVGGNAFKDRGALERADFLGPTAQLVNPVDNDASGNDRNTAANQVTLLNALLTDFSIQLLDVGVGIDATTVLPASFVVTRRVNGVTTPLVAGLDYVLSYDTNSRIARLIPAQGLWINGIYEITLINVGINAIKDIAGNVLQNNTTDGVVKFVVNLTDTITSPWQNPNNPVDVNDDGRVNGSDLLLLINRILLNQGGQLPLVATPPPYLDPTGDGRLNTSDLLAVINYILSPPTSAAPLVATADESSPEVTPLAASPDAGDANAVSLGLAASQQKSSPADEPAAAPAVAAPDSPSSLSSRSVDRVMYEEMPRFEGVEGSESWGADLDGILGDLDDELEARISV